MGTLRIERSAWLVKTVMVSVAAYFGATGLSAVASMAMPHGAVASPFAPPELTKHDALAKSADPILRRNPFDSITGSLLRVAYASEPTPERDSLDPRDAPSCDKIHATVIAAFEDPDVSVAALEVDGVSLLRRRGGEVGTAKLEYISIDRVFLRQDGKLCQAQLFAPLPSQAPPRAGATPHVEPGALDPKIADGIVRDGPGHYRIDRRVVERLLEDQSEIMKGGVIRPEKEGDKTVGVRLAGVRPDRLFGVLGLKDDDVIRSLNGYDFSSPERMLEAFARLRNATQLVLDFTRGGQPSSYTYSIQ
jgi:general secretion pathway protein C